MRVQLTDVSKGTDGHALPATTLTMQSGAASFVHAETAQRPTVLGLIASGRMRQDGGTVTIDGEADTRQMRRKIALIDAPDVCEPEGNVTVAAVAAEELMFAGKSSHPIAVNRLLDSLGLRDIARSTMADVAPVPRLRLLTELAVLREGVESVVIVSPDRHGGDPQDWWRMARELASRGYAVLVIAGAAARAAIDAAGYTPVSSSVSPDSVPLFSLDESK